MKDLMYLPKMPSAANISSLAPLTPDSDPNCSVLMYGHGAIDLDPPADDHEELLLTLGIDLISYV